MTEWLRGHQSSDHTSRVKLRLSARSTTSFVAMTIHTIIAHLLVLLLAVANQSYGKPDRQIRGKDADIARSYFFDVDLFEAITREEQTKNVVLSPISVKLVLGMLMEGAQGETSEQIRKALRLRKDRTEARKTMKHWVDAFREPAENTTINLANHIFVSKKFSLNSNYKKTVVENYGGKVSHLDMSDGTSAANTINEWVKKETNGVIKKLADESQIGPDTHGILTSAVYFKGSWKKPFTGTAVHCFFKTEDHCTKTVFMQKEDQLMYAHISSINADVIELPYRDERFSMMVLIPRDSVQELNRDLPREQLHRVISAMKPVKLHLQLPRFVAEFQQDLVPALNQQRIRDAFSKNANFSGILNEAKEPFSVSHMLHSAKVVVDEGGTEAAAATEALIAPLIGADTIIADKPFIFYIKDSLSNVILFAGLISDPEKAEELPVTNRDSVIVQEAQINKIPEESISPKRRRPGPPAPLTPYKPARPNGFSSSQINFAEKDDEEPEAAKPSRSITTTTPHPFIRTNPPKTANSFTTTTPPPFIRTIPPKTTTKKPMSTTTPTIVRINPPQEMMEKPAVPETTDTNLDYSDEEGLLSFLTRNNNPRSTFYIFYGRAKTSQWPERRFVFSS